MANLLDQLKEMTTIVADTGDVEAIKSVSQSTRPPTHRCCSRPVPFHSMLR